MWAADHLPLLRRCSGCVAVLSVVLWALGPIGVAVGAVVIVVLFAWRSLRT